MISLSRKPCKYNSLHRFSGLKKKSLEINFYRFFSRKDIFYCVSKFKICSKDVKMTLSKEVEMLS